MSRPLSPLEELSLLLRPAGGGVHVVSTGVQEQRAVQAVLYGTSETAEVSRIFRERLMRIASAKVVLLGVPSDVGAGYRRGSNLAPPAIRQLLYRDPGIQSAMASGALLDIGDVFCVPQLLQDEMLSSAQLSATRRAIYPEHAGHALPVSPLSIEERALDLVLKLNPRARPFVIGGDHSVAWPVIAALARVRKDGLGIVQPDAHTDLLDSRLGVRICFATWSFHANELLGRGGRLVQVGVRASRSTREQWESGLGVRQFWADDCRDLSAIDGIVSHLKKVGVKRIYFSNDIDGTSAEFAPATGTPEPSGLTPEFVIELIRRLSREFELTAGDIVEVAPPLGPDESGAQKTVALAATYLSETIQGALRSAA